MFRPSCVKLAFIARPATLTISLERATPRYLQNLLFQKLLHTTRRLTSERD